MPLYEQIRNFARTREYMVNAVGINVTMNILKGAVFSITIGSNDVLNYFQQPFVIFKGNVSMTMFQESMVSNLTIHLKVNQIPWLTSSQ